MRGGYLPRSAVAIAPRPDVGIDSLGKLSARGIPSRNYGSCLFVGSRTNPRRRSFCSDTPTTTAARRKHKRSVGLVSYMPLAAAGTAEAKRCLLAARNLCAQAEHWHSSTTRLPSEFYDA